MTQTSVADLRRDYTRAGLSEEDAELDAIAQFQRWFEQAVTAEIPEPNAMTLATATPQGKPDARIVLLKGYDEQGFVFYTNYTSSKGEQLAQTPWGALVFWWVELERQVCIEGHIEPVSPQESDEYFRSRPRGSQLGAWASPQSQVIASRSVLEDKLQALAAEYGEEKPIPRPPHWGGYRLWPDCIEFWQGRPNRLHDRLFYRRQPDGSWQRDRLAP